MEMDPLQQKGHMVLLLKRKKQLLRAQLTFEGTIWFNPKSKKNRRGNDFSHSFGSVQHILMWF
jgi:hypothetical protein